MTRSENKDPNVQPSPDIEKFSDIEDAELNKYILNTKERRLKTALWKLINRDYSEVATEQTKTSGEKPRYTEKSGKEKKRKRGRDGDVSNQGQGLANKAVEQDAKKNKVESSVANDHGISNDAMDNWTGEEFTFNDDEV